MKNKAKHIDYSKNVRESLNRTIGISDKYYAPELKEFVPGFVFEYWEPVDQEWVEEVFTSKTDWREIEDMLKEGAYRPIRALKR